MARPQKCRRICCYPEVLDIKTTGDASDDPVILTVDEYETIRLIDREGLSQEECGSQLGVGRTTAQKIYETARRKIAEAIVLGRSLRIDGGDYYICNGDSEFCYKKSCLMRQYQTEMKIDKGDCTMRIAVTYENGEIFQHFGHTDNFKIYDVEDKKIVKTEVVGTNGFGHGALAGFLSALKVDILICGGIGGGAQTALSHAGIKLFGGVSGSSDAAVEAYLAGSLDFNPDVKCSHHEHEHGSHGCGKGNCGKC